jgi:hypothetical protein
MEVNSPQVLIGDERTSANSGCDDGFFVSATQVTASTTTTTDDRPSYFVDRIGSCVVSAILFDLSYKSILGTVYWLRAVL